MESAVPLSVPVATNFKEAVVRLVNAKQVISRKLTEQRMRPIAEGAHPELLDFVALFYDRMDKRAIPVFAHTIVRTAQEQRKLFLDGFSRDDPSDGIWPHRGCAADIVHSIYAWDMSEYEWLIFGEVGKELAIQRSIDIVWGGDWLRKPTDRVGWDPAHWELRNFRTLCADYPWSLTNGRPYAS